MSVEPQMSGRPSGSQSRAQGTSAMDPATTRAMRNNEGTPGHRQRVDAAVAASRRSPTDRIENGQEQSLG